MAEEISPLENHGWWMKQLRKDAKHKQGNKMDQVTLPRTVVERVLEALTFYADGSNQELLTRFKNGNRIDLEARGFSMTCEYYDGSENYVEDGRAARMAADVLREALDQAEHVSKV